jgi:hypothetical protein
MRRGRKTALIILIVLVGSLATLSPLLVPRTILLWKKHQAHARLAKLGPDIQRNLNVLPKAIALPAPKSPAVLLRTIEVASFLYTVPEPVAQEIRATSALILTYPQFTATFMGAFPSMPADAISMRAYGKPSFEHEQEVATTTIHDIDRQPDLPSLSLAIMRLSEKISTLSLETHFTWFDQPDRRGFIRAVKPDMNELHALVYLPKHQVNCGIFFRNPAAVRPVDVEEFLSILQITPIGTATSPSPSSQPAR